MKLLGGSYTVSYKRTYGRRRAFCCRGIGTVTTDYHLLPGVSGNPKNQRVRSVRVFAAPPLTKRIVARVRVDRNTTLEYIVGTRA